MNFLKFLFKLRFFFFVVLSGISLVASPFTPDFQKNTEVQYSHLVYPPALSGGEVNDFCFDKSGLLYISYGSKLGIFDGSRWKVLNTGRPVNFSVSGSGAVFFTDGKDIFSLQLDSGLNYFFKPVFDSLLLKDRKIEQFLCLENHFLINDGKHIFKGNDKGIQEVATSQAGTKIHQTASRIILQSGEEYAVYSTLSGAGKFVEMPFRATLFIDHPQGYLACNSSGSIFILAPSLGLNQDWPIKTGGIKVAANISDSLFVWIDQDGNISLNDFSGFQKFSYHSRFKDSRQILRISPSGEIWVAEGQGFLILDPFPYPAILNAGDKFGNIRFVDVSEGEIYVATSEGLFNFIRGKQLFPGDCDYVRRTDQGILFRSGKTLQIIRDDDHAEEILEHCDKFMWDQTSGRIVYLSQGKLMSFRPEGQEKRLETYGQKNGYTDFFAGSGKVLGLSDGRLHYYPKAGTEASQIDLPDGIKESDVVEFRLTGDYLILNTGKGVFMTKFGTNEAVEYELISPGFSGLRFFNENLFAFSNQFGIRFFDQPEHEHFLWIPLEILKDPGAGYYLLDENACLVSTGEKLLLVEKNIREDRKPGQIIIKELKINGRILFDGADFESAIVFLRKDLNSIPIRNNRIEIEFGTTGFFSHSDFFYYELQSGNSHFISDTLEGKRLKIENLHHGNYKLDLHILTENGGEAEVFSLNFGIDSPFYLKWYFFLIYFSFAGILLFVFFRIYMMKKHHVEKEKQPEIKIEAFHSAQPEELKIAEKHKFDSNIDQSEKKSKWDKYEMVTVLFSDIQGFTRIAESMNPERLIDELDQFFFHFDSVVDRYSIEKIKTIGDAYMAAGGIPRRNSTNPVEVVLAALEMQQYMQELKRTKVDIWDLRIGIHSGPVIGGKVGSKKRAFDIWGDTVNIASRMESSGEGGKVNISGETHTLVRDFFLCEYRGKLPVKYKGNLDMYFVKGLRPELSINLIGLPNRKFFLQLQLQRLNDLEDYIFAKLEEELPRGMYFHTAEYSSQVYHHAYLLAKSENLDPEETLIIRTAALLLNTGYIFSYNNPETESARLSREILADFQYSERQINAVANLILAAKPPFEPGNIMEMIIIDSSMHYLGRSDYNKIYKLLFLEENELKGKVDSRTWKEGQVKLLSEFRFYTAAARKLNEIPFTEQIRNLETDIM